MAIVALRVILLLLICGAITIVIAAMMMARLLLRPPRMSDGKAAYLLRRVTPADLDLRYEPMTFDVPDAAQPGQRLQLAAWWLPAIEPSNRTAILLHGYADAKVGSIAWAPLLLSMGVNVLAIDLRAHGESGGTMTTAGYFERHDLDAAINQLKAQRPRETERLILYGISLGGPVAIATANLRSDIAAVVMDSPYADYVESLDDRARLLGSPGGPLPWLAGRFAAWWAHADFAAVRPIDGVAASRCPVLVIQGTRDLITHPAIRQQYADAIAKAPAGSVHLVLDDVGHLAGFRDAPDAYTAAVRALL